MSKSQPFCLMPWIHFHVGNKGVAKACCVANIPYGNINSDSLEEIWEGDAIQKVRAKFAAGEVDKRCAVCMHQEAVGNTSIRQETFDKFPHIDIHAAPSFPVYFDIRFSNVCNFRCRTCWHGASSKWFSDAKKLGTAIGKKAIIKNVQDFENFIQKTGKALLQAEEIYFAGGEPLVTEEHYLLLEWLIQRGATQMRLRYNTNFSKLQFKHYDALQLWQHFPKVELLASIDASEQLGEYIRKEMDWSVILANREKIRALTHVEFKLAPTISVFNMAHLPTLYQQALDLDLIDKTDWYINILERPLHYNIQILPLAQKTTINQAYSTFFEWMAENAIPQAIQSSFQECLAYMNAQDQSRHWEKFLKETQQLDKLRGESSFIEH